MKKNRIAAGIGAVALMVSGLFFAASPAKAESHFSIGIGVGPAYYPPPPVVYRPPYPGPGYYWTDGYYDPYGVWVSGFWSPRTFVRPYYAPRFYGGGGFRRVFDRDDFRGRRDWDRGRRNAFGYRR